MFRFPFFDDVLQMWWVSTSCCMMLSTNIATAMVPRIHAVRRAARLPCCSVLIRCMARSGSVQNIAVRQHTVVNDRRRNPAVVRRRRGQRPFQAARAFPHLCRRALLREPGAVDHHAHEDELRQTEQEAARGLEWTLS